jgi:hypothetical protein
MSLMPGIDRQGFTAPATITWDADGIRLAAPASPHSGPDMFGDMSDPNTRYFPLTSRSEQELARIMFVMGPDDAERLVAEVAAHRALGADYIVSPRLSEVRASGRRRWPGIIGACTVDEAFRLVGTKSRMYRFVPMEAEPGYAATINVGRMYDLAVTRFTPHLRRAIGGALSPDADESESATAQHLLAVRERLRDLLIARDAIYRLTRREALGPAWLRPFDPSRASGSGGNDLTTHLTYQLSAALNVAYAATDNLAWVLALRDDAGVENREIGLTTLLGRRHRSWTEGQSVTAGRAAIMRSKSLSFTLGAREVRNRFMHHEGVNYGFIDWLPSTDAPLAGLTGLWIFRDVLGALHLRGGTVDLFNAVAAESQFVSGDMTVLTFMRFIDQLWTCTSQLIADGLGAVTWGSSHWSGQPEASDLARRWRSRLQRRLWGV